jgi:hypothetical protein
MRHTLIRENLPRTWLNHRHNKENQAVLGAWSEAHRCGPFRGTRGDGYLDFIRNRIAYANVSQDQRNLLANDSSNVRSADTSAPGTGVAIGATQETPTTTQGV